MGEFLPLAPGLARDTAGLMYLQHAFKLSDEAVVARWVENPYYQHFTGETFFVQGRAGHLHTSGSHSDGRGLGNGSRYEGTTTSGG